MPVRYVLPGMIPKVELEQLENTVALVTIQYQQDPPACCQHQHSWYGKANVHWQKPRRDDALAVVEETQSLRVNMTVARRVDEKTGESQDRLFATYMPLPKLKPHQVVTKYPGL